LGDMLQIGESGIFGDCKWTVFELLPAGIPPLPKHLEASRSFVTFFPFLSSRLPPTIGLSSGEKPGYCSGRGFLLRAV
jgi:hypothetical protein